PEIQERIDVQPIETPLKMRERGDSAGRAKVAFRESRDAADIVGVLIGGLEPVVAEEAVSDRCLVSKYEELVQLNRGKRFVVDSSEAREHVLVRLPC